MKQTNDVTINRVVGECTLKRQLNLDRHEVQFPWTVLPRFFPPSHEKKKREKKRKTPEIPWRN